MKAICRHFVLVWIALAIGSPTHAADTPPMRFDRIAVDEGLSQNAVLSIHQDQTGFIWMGTEDGLNQYDGLSFRHFNHDPSDIESLSNDFIFALAQDRQGKLWIATDGGGLQIRDPETGRFSTFSSNDEEVSLPDHLRALMMDDRGVLWVGSRRDGLFRIQAQSGRVTQYRHDPDDPGSLSDDSVFAMASDGGQIWVATNGGLNRFDPATGLFGHLTAESDGLCSDQVRSLLVDRSGVLWIGTNGGGLCTLSPTTGRIRSFRHDPQRPASLGSDRVNALLQDADGRIWIGSDAGLNLLVDAESGRFARFQHDPSNRSSLGDDYIRSLFSDRSGVLWVGTKHGGVSKWNPRSWSFNHQPAQRADGFASSNVSSFAEDSAGNLWVGAVGGGVTIVQRESGAAASLQDTLGGDELSDSRVMSLLGHSRGEMWVGTMAGGLNRVDPVSGAVTTYRHSLDPGSLSADGIMALFEARNGDLWVGTYGGGVNRFDFENDRFERHQAEEAVAGAFSGARATAIGQTADGTVWVGTDGGGLNYLGPGAKSWGHYRHDPSNADSLSADTIYSLYGGPDGVLWIGTRAGLDRLDPDSVDFMHLSMADGLPNDSIYGILPDNDGNLWLTHNRGLTRLSTDTGELRNFNRSHGLQGDEFNFGAWYRTSRGELVVGGANGFNRFQPSALRFNQVPPPVVLSGFALFNRPVQLGVPPERLQRVDLKYTDDVVTFEFAALDFTAPRENRYRYQLQGFDDQWVEARGVPRATYTNLDAGNYAFRVVAANSDGVWNEQGLNIPMSVAPPPWATWWAYLLYAIAALLLVGLMLRAQRQRLAREVAFRERLQHEVAERTAELAQRNTQLKEANASLERASLTDPLTGLRNRRFMAGEVEREITLIQRHYSEAEKNNESFNETLAFVMVDLDHFKPINDKFGHAAGDQILLGISRILTETCRVSDFVVRWGGDEFLVMGRHNNAVETEKLAERIRSQIAEHIFSIGGGNVARTTASIGFACYPFLPHDPQRLTWEQVVAVADAALYRAKGWRNAWVGYFPTPESTGVPNLLKSISSDADQLNRDGLLDIRHSRSADQEATSA